MKKLYKDIKLNNGRVQFAYPYMYIKGDDLKKLLKITLKHADRLDLKVYKHIDPVTAAWDFIILT